MADDAPIVALLAPTVAAVLAALSCRTDAPLAAAAMLATLVLAVSLVTEASSGTPAAVALGARCRRSA